MAVKRTLVIATLACRDNRSAMARMKQRGIDPSTMSSLLLGTLSQQRFGRLRGHWCLDVTFREDESRVRDRNTATNLVWLKRFGLNLVKQQDGKYSIAMRRRVAG